jgi:hypothetical protein
MLLAAGTGALGRDVEFRKSRVPRAETAAPGGVSGSILWIFDATFDDLTGDNAGWNTIDLSGTRAQTNFWHHDTIRITPYTHLGDTTWWCGTVDPCWRQPRGYGNEWWCQILERTMVEMGVTSPGDLIVLEYDQRYAMERDYDYGYVDVSNDGGASWTTVMVVTNAPGPAGGTPCDWGDPCGHEEIDLSSYAGAEMELRFRFESDESFSSEDSSAPSVTDGAWQIDNITLKRNGTPIFYDDAESGNMDWKHDDCPSAGQTGVTFFRGQYGIDFVTGRPYVCDDRPYGSWMYVAVDPFTSTMVDGQNTVLLSPPIDISGATGIVGEWEAWVDLPEAAHDVFDLYLAADDAWDCVSEWSALYQDEDPGWWYDGECWGVWRDNWSHVVGSDWLGVAWPLMNYSDAEVPHMGGFFLDRMRVGLPAAATGTVFQRDIWNSFNDWFPCELATAMIDVARIRVTDVQGVHSVHLLASGDGGVTWSSYPCVAGHGDWWTTPAPVTEMVPGSEVLYYWEATDGVGNIAVYPESAPGRCFEMSILPINGSILDPSILLVDKHGRRIPGDERDWGSYDAMGRGPRYSESYYTSALAILGYEWDTYDVEVPSGNVKSDGPDTCGMKYYDTQMWITGDNRGFTLSPRDQLNLILWLDQALVGTERNLLLSGNDIGYELVQVGREVAGFYSTWLASSYVQDKVGAVTVDTVPGLIDRPGGWEFMRDDGDPTTPLDGDCALAGGCPSINYFDVVDRQVGVVGNEVVADYCLMDGSRLPAGVAYTHPVMSYQTVNLGFGMEYMVDGDCAPTGPNTHAYYEPVTNYFVPGTPARADLMENILDFFGLPPTVPGTGVPDGGSRNSLAQAAPNPFNPVTKIAFSVREAGPVTIEIHNVAGRVVRTILDEELEAGTDGYVTWDGTNDRGERCASGVYFYRIRAPGFVASRKMVMLK